jgi:hypothetical protein
MRPTMMKTEIVRAMKAVDARGRIPALLHGYDTICKCLCRERGRIASSMAVVRFPLGTGPRALSATAREHILRTWRSFVGPHPEPHR